MHIPAPLPHVPELHLIGVIEGGWTSVELYYRTTLPEEELGVLLMDAFTAQGWHDFERHFPTLNGFLAHDEWPEWDRRERTGLEMLGHPPTGYLLQCELMALEHETLVKMASPHQYGHGHDLWKPDPIKWAIPMPALKVWEDLHVEVLSRRQQVKRHDCWGHVSAHLTGPGETEALHEHFSQQLQVQGWTRHHAALAEPLSTSTWQRVDVISEVHGTLILRRLSDGHWLAQFEAVRQVETGSDGVFYSG
ncbi:hypothetical protein GCM10010844_34810 [Deinococcus radiotolerans]|uniref:Uncharacterized protein n=2 Tax=Deinococcus radiotolerans TaxID=1309407 RepID=A0ABQ2FP34_9DEIO|nr:hypothetical protein GCM10010844_34810 [Deinococcus radiotolerans]